MQLKAIMNREGLEAVKLGNLISLPSANDRGYAGRRSSKFEAFMQQQMVESSQSYNFGVPVVQGSAFCLGNLIYWQTFHASAVVDQLDLLIRKTSHIPQREAFWLRTITCSLFISPL